ncbi:MAG: YbaB/EbfC family nucleoid-associated protein [Candidatus Dadabacteria bacterium]|nr:MAG: YbaB/EbfC family nucleoid-associated protein [Candidatus Dadabacteria bacterium]
MARGFGGVPGNMQAMLKQAQKLQEKIQKTREEAENLTAEGTAGGGVVKVVASGRNLIESVEIAPEAVNPDDVEMLQDLVLAAANSALQGVQDKVKAEMEKVAGGMNIPGLF